MGVEKTIAIVVSRVMELTHIHMHDTHTHARACTPFAAAACGSPVAAGELLCVLKADVPGFQYALRVARHDLQGWEE